jgi:hypothetical protein
LKEEIDEDVIKASKAKQAESLADTTPNSANSGQNTTQTASNGKLLDISQLMNGFRAPRKCQSRK